MEANYSNALKPGQEIKLEEIKVLIDKASLEVREKTNLLIFYAFPFTIVALFGSIFGAFKWAAEMAKDKAKEVFKDPETLLKESKSILVLTPDGESDGWLQKFFQLMGFKMLCFCKISELDSVKSKHFDIAILNVPSDVSGKDSAFKDNISEMTMATSVFYFGLGRVSNETLEKDGRLSYANAKSQLLGNLINALKYQQML